MHGARASPPADRVFDPLWGFRFAGAGFADDSHGVVVEMFGDRDAANELLEGDDFFSVKELHEFLADGSGGGPCNFLFLGSGGVADFDEEHEAVKLGFRERVGAFLFDGILCGEDEKWCLKGVGVAEDGDFIFLHGLEHGRLGFCWRAVDFVSEDDVCEDRAFDELELAPAAHARFLNDVSASDVGGHEVWGELNAVE